MNDDKELVITISHRRKGKASVKFGILTAGVLLSASMMFSMTGCSADSFNTGTLDNFKAESSVSEPAWRKSYDLLAFQSAIDTVKENYVGGTVISENLKTLVTDLTELNLELEDNDFSNVEDIKKAVVMADEILSSVDLDDVSVIIDDIDTVRSQYAEGSNALDSVTSQLGIARFFSAVTSVVAPKEVTSKAGDAMDLNVKLLPSTATDKTFTVTSTDPSVVVASPKGVLNFVKAGKTTVKITTPSGISHTITVTVTEAKPVPVPSNGGNTVTEKPASKPSKPVAEKPATKPVAEKPSGDSGWKPPVVDFLDEEKPEDPMAVKYIKLNSYLFDVGERVHDELSHLGYDIDYSEAFKAKCQEMIWAKFEEYGADFYSDPRGMHATGPAYSKAHMYKNSPEVENYCDWSVYCK